MADLKTKSDFAKLGGRSPAAVTLATKPGGALQAALVGTRIDADHPAARKWLSKGTAAPTAPPPKAAPTPPQPARAPTRTPRPEPPENDEPAAIVTTGTPLVSEEELEELHRLLSPIVERFGTALAFKDYLAALKTIVDIREKDLKNEQTRGLLISRELVQVHLFGHIESAHKRLLTESVKTIARRAMSETKAGKSLQDVEKTVHDIISTQLKTLKQRAQKSLRGERDD